MKRGERDAVAVEIAFLPLTRKRAQSDERKVAKRASEQTAIKFISKTFRAKPCLFPFVSGIGRNGEETMFRIHSVGHAQVAPLRILPIIENSGNENPMKRARLYTNFTRRRDFSLPPSRFVTFSYERLETQK